MLVTYAIAIVLGLGILCLIAFWLVVADAQHSVEPPPLPRYGEEEHE